MISVEIVINDGRGSEIRLAHGDVADLQYVLKNLVKPVGYVLSTRPWTKEEMEALDAAKRLDEQMDRMANGFTSVSNAEVVKTTEESRGGCANLDASGKYDSYYTKCSCNTCATKEFMDEYRSHI